MLYIYGLGCKEYVIFLGIKKIEESLYEEYKEMNFGCQNVTSLQLCAMDKKQKSGYYHVEHEVFFPGAKSSILNVDQPDIDNSLTRPETDASDREIKLDTSAKRDTDVSAIDSKLSEVKPDLNAETDLDVDGQFYKVKTDIKADADDGSTDCKFSEVQPPISPATDAGTMNSEFGDVESDTRTGTDSCPRDSEQGQFNEIV